MIWKMSRIGLFLAATGLGLAEDGRAATGERDRANLSAGAGESLPPSAVSPSAVPGKNCETGRGINNRIGRFRRCVRKNNWNNGNTRDNDSGPFLTPDGRFVVFTSIDNLDNHRDDITLASDSSEGSATADVFRLDLQTGDLQRVSVGAGDRLARVPGHVMTLPDGNEAPALAVSFGAAISADGRLVAFVTDGAFLRQDTNDKFDAYIKDLATGDLTLVSAHAGRTAVGGVRLVAMSDDGRFVAFDTSSSLNPGRDRGADFDVYVKDINKNRFLLASIDSNGRASGGELIGITPNGRFVVFITDAAIDTTDGDGLHAVYVWDRFNRFAPPLLGSDNSISPAPGVFIAPDLSRNGRFVVFQIGIPPQGQRVQGDSLRSDIYRLDLVDHTLVQVDLDAQSRQTALDDDSFDPAISASGRFVAFSSSAGDLVLGDNNHGRNDRTSDGLDINEDIFVKDLRTGAIVRANVDEDGIEVNGTSYEPSLSANGKVIAFVTDDANLLDPAPGNQNGPGDTVVVTGVDFRVPRPLDVPGDPAGAVSIGRNFDPISFSAGSVPEPNRGLNIDFALRNTIEQRGDQDWFRVFLFQGHQYQIDLEGPPTRQGTLDDPLLHVFRAKAPGQIPEPGPFDDDGGVGLNAQLVFQPPADGFYFISAESYGAATGTYRLLVRECDPDNPVEPCTP